MQVLSNRMPVANDDEFEDGEEAALMMAEAAIALGEGGAFDEDIADEEEERMRGPPRHANLDGRDAARGRA